MKVARWKSCLPWLGLPVLIGILAALQWSRTSLAALLPRLVILCFGYAAALWDLRKKCVPNRLVAAMASCWVLLMVPRLFVQTDVAVPILIQGLLGGLLGGGMFFLVYLISRRGLGGGDVKFMAAAGLYLGVNGVLPTMLCGSVLAALTGILMILFKRIGRKDSIPLIPFLYVGMLLTIYFLQGGAQ